MELNIWGVTMCHERGHWIEINNTICRKFLNVKCFLLDMPKLS